MAGHWTRLLPALILFLPIAAGQGDETLEVQLRAAMHKELVEGDLPGAIELYQKVASNPDAPRATVARALLQMGLCYEKLGDALARPAYRKLIDGYPEQVREVEVAKQRLAEMAKSSAVTVGKPTFQHIQMTARLYGPASLSPEGDRLAFTSDGSLWVVPVHGKVHPDIAGVPERLTEPMGAWGPLAWSRDGHWIAFNVDKSDVYIIQSSGGEPTRVDAGVSRRGSWLDYAISLSPDGAKLAYESWSEGQKKVLVMPVPGGTAIPLSLERPRQPSFSPDGRWIACVSEFWTHRIEDGEPKGTVRGELWIAPASGGEAVLVTEIPGHARSPVWSPDGKSIAYLQDDGTNEFTRELRIIPIRDNGGPAAPSTKLELPFVTLDLLAGWTRRNEIGILKVVEGRSGIYKVAAKGGRAALLRLLDGDHPRWSPDGSRLYFRYRGRIAWIASGGGKPTEIPFRTSELVEAVPGGGNEPSPDGSRLVLAGLLKVPGETSTNIWTVPSDGGVPLQITDFPPTANARFPCWSPDGNAIAFVGAGPNIYIVPAEGGESRRVTSAEDRVAWACIAWSPDGRYIAYFSSDVALNLFDLRAAESRVLVALRQSPGQRPQASAPLRENEISWAPDGRQLAYTNGGGIWLVALDNPQPVQVETGRAELRARWMDWSPDGKWLAFTGDTGFDRQLVLMTDFMPLVTR